MKYLLIYTYNNINNNNTDDNNNNLNYFQGNICKYKVNILA